MKHKELNFTICSAPARLPLQLSIATPASWASSLVRRHYSELIFELTENILEDQIGSVTSSSRPVIELETRFILQSGGQAEYTAPTRLRSSSPRNSSVSRWPSRRW